MGFEVDEGCRHLAPVAKFERPFAQPATGDDADGIGGAAIDLDEGDQALAVPSARFLDAQARASQHRHTHAQHLARAQMSMGDPGFFKKLIESWHGFRHGRFLSRMMRTNEIPDSQVTRFPCVLTGQG